MSALSIRAGVCRFTLLAALTFLVHPAPARAATEAAKLSPEIQAYADRVKADKDAAQQALIVANRSRLMNEPGTQTFGNPQGDVTIVEFFDYQCGYCKADEPLLQQAMKDDPGIRLVIKEYPILGPMSLVAAKTSLAVALQGKYLPFHQALMAFRGHLDQSVIDQTAKDVGVDLDRLRKDQADPAIALATDEIIIGNFNLARALRFFQTPSFVVGTKFLDSPRTVDDFKKAIADARTVKN